MKRRIPDSYGKNMMNVGGLGITLYRTVRVPEGQLNSLPAGLGTFPVYSVNEFKSGTPKEWREDAHFIPMYNSEAMWMSFRAQSQPRALIVGAGHINAISGKPFSGKRGSLDIKLDAEDQNYVVAPTQPWLDGWKAKDGKVYQFVAAEMGSGETVEGQLTGEESIGGIQFITYKSDKKLHTINPPHHFSGGGFYEGAKCLSASFGTRSNSVGSMGLGRGGEIEQKIYPDPYGASVWNAVPAGVSMLYIVNSEDFKQVTGYDAPHEPLTREDYARMGLPWFNLVDGHMGDAGGSDTFDKLKPVTDPQKDPFDKIKPKKDDLKPDYHFGALDPKMLDELKKK